MICRVLTVGKFRYWKILDLEQAYQWAEPSTGCRQYRVTTTLEAVQETYPHQSPDNNLPT